jgi:hypothetical protein
MSVSKKFAVLRKTLDKEDILKKYQISKEDPRVETGKLGPTETADPSFCAFNFGSLLRARLLLANFGWPLVICRFVNKMTKPSFALSCNIIV